MKLPGGDRAIVSEEKLVGYALSFEHHDGNNKARVFSSALGLRAADWEDLRSALLSIAAGADAERVGTNEIGDLYRIDFVLEFRSRKAGIRSGWIVPHDGSPTWLTTVFVKD